MSLRKYRERLRILDRHIKTNSSGNTECLAFKLGLSTAGTYKFLEEVKEEGFPIKHSRREKRFYYDPKGEMIGYVFVKDTDDTDNGSEEKIAGGVKGGVKLFSNYTYSRNWAGNFVFSLKSVNHFAWQKVIKLIS